MTDFNRAEEKWLKTYKTEDELVSGKYLFTIRKQVYAPLGGFRNMKCICYEEWTKNCQVHDKEGSLLGQLLAN